jgi:hypothetical protein
MQIGKVTGRRMLEIAQAQAVMCIYYQQHGECGTYVVSKRRLVSQPNGSKDG